VNTVFDFRNQKRNPGKPWPLLDSIEDYRLIDVLIMDCEEAMKISGTASIDEAARFSRQPRFRLSSSPTGQISFTQNRMVCCLKRVNS